MSEIEELTVADAAIALEMSAASVRRLLRTGHLVAVGPVEPRRPQRVSAWSVLSYVASRRDSRARVLAERVAVRQPFILEPEGEFGDRTWDVFLSYASEDRAEVASPLQELLENRGVSVWLDVAQMKMGWSLRRSIDRGLRSSRFAAVILSRHYFSKGWPQYELDGIVSLSIGGRQNLLPIWHGVGFDEVSHYSPSLADKFARDTARTSVSEIADEISALVIEARRLSPRH